MSSSSPSDDFEDDDDARIKPVGTFRYLNIADTPCYRDSLLYSITASLTAGLTQFMFTSNVRRSTNTALMTLSGTVLLYYPYCRHKLASDKFKFQQVKHNLREYVNQRGKLDEDEE